jgi:hypothetical protein
MALLLCPSAPVDAILAHRLTRGRSSG